MWKDETLWLNGLYRIHNSLFIQDGLHGKRESHLAPPFFYAGPRQNEPSACGWRFDQFFIFQKLVARFTIPFSFLFLENSYKSRREKCDLPWLCDSFKLAVMHSIEKRVEGEGFSVSHILTLWVCSVELPEAKAAGKIGNEWGSFPTRFPSY